MIDNDQIRALDLKVRLMRCLVNNEAIDMELVINFLQLNEYSTVAVSETEAFAQADAFFELVINTLTDNKIKVLPDKINFKEIFRALLAEIDESVIDFFEQFLKFYVEDDILKTIDERLNKLLVIDYNNVPNDSKTKRLFFYNALLLAIAKSPLDLELIEDLNEKLQNTI